MAAVRERGTELRAKKPSRSNKSASEEIAELRTEIDILKQEKENLSRQVYRLQLERDVLTLASKFLKKTRASVCRR